MSTSSVSIEEKPKQNIQEEEMSCESQNQPLPSEERPDLITTLFTKLIEKYKEDDDEEDEDEGEEDEDEGEEGEEGEEDDLDEMISIMSDLTESQRYLSEAFLILVNLKNNA